MSNTFGRRFIVSRRSVNTTTDQSALEIRAGDGKGFTIWRVKITIAAATTSVYALGVPAAVGVTPTSPLALVSMERSNALEPTTGQTRTALAWATSPTPPTVAVERVSFPATIGAYQEIKFQDGFYVAADSSFVVQNEGTTSAADITVEISE